jgi:hypothetical protein
MPKCMGRILCKYLSKLKMLARKKNWFLFDQRITDEEFFYNVDTRYCEQTEVLQPTNNDTTAEPQTSWSWARCQCNKTLFFAIGALGK